MGLFAAIARSRPEWVAQGLLRRALETEPKVQHLILGRRGRPRQVAFDLSVREEVPHETRWRADLQLAWNDRAGKPQAKRLELKLAAKLTPSQLGALARGSIDVLVAPKGWRLPDGCEPKCRHLTWHAIANACSCRELQALLLEVDAFASVEQEQLSVVELVEVFDAFATRNWEEGWWPMYRFLLAVDRALEGRGYEASERWSVSNRAAEPYYGYHFALRGEQRWFGFSRTHDGPRLVLQHREGRRWLECQSIEPHYRRYTVDATVAAIRAR